MTGTGNDASPRLRYPRGATQLGANRMDDELARLRLQTAQMGIVAMWLKTFASEIIGHVLNGNTLDYLAVYNIKKKCTTDLKNIDVIGVEITQEAETLGKAIELFEKMTEIAIKDGWKLKKR
jgi:hypothetical protein